MQFEALMDQLAAGPKPIHALTLGTSPEEAQQRPAPDAWSMRDIVCHLVDEERGDFRAHLATVLDDPQVDWKPIDFDRIDVSHDYASHDLDERLGMFAIERERSLEWLRGLVSPDWDATYQTSWGTMRAGDILAAWVAHDVLHQRQLVRLRYSLVSTLAEPYSLGYAGTW